MTAFSSYFILSFCKCYAVCLFLGRSLFNLNVRLNPQIRPSQIKMRSAFVILLISVSLHIFYVIKYQALVDIFIFHSIRLSKRKKPTNASITTVVLCKSTFGITSFKNTLTVCWPTFRKRHKGWTTGVQRILVFLINKARN